VIDLCKVAIIIPCRNEGIYLKQTVDFILQTEARDGTKIIIVNDGSKDRSCSFLNSGQEQYSNIKLLTTNGIGAANARNLGAETAQEAEILVFCDGHIIMAKGWLNSLLVTFDEINVSAVCPGIGPFDPARPAGYGQTWNDQLEIQWLPKTTDIHEVPLIPGACFAIRRSVFEKVGGFDRGFHSWGYEDVELSLKLWLFGFNLFVNPAVRIGHKFRRVPPYAVEPAEFLYNRLRMCICHMNDRRVDKMAKILKKYSCFEEVLQKIFISDTYDQRKRYVMNRTYDDDWFFDKFKIPF